MNKFIVSLIALTLILASCKKGKEDPFISLRSRNKRITGKWNIDDYQVNGKSITTVSIETYKDSSSACNTTFIRTISRNFNTWTISFKEDNSYTEDITGVSNTNIDFYDEYYCPDANFEESYFNTTNGSWAFNNKKDKITLTADNVTKEYDIIGLSNKKLHLKGYFDIDGDSNPDNIEIYANKNEL
tara:strand:- start:15759 stop:16316 length:558 start_codon:yes stop_codon:yes gene_type:complete